MVSLGWQEKRENKETKVLVAKLDALVRRSKCFKCMIKTKFNLSIKTYYYLTRCLMQVSLDLAEMSGLLASKVSKGYLGFKEHLVDMGYKVRKVSMERFLEHPQAHQVTKGYLAFRGLKAKLVNKEMQVIQVNHHCIKLSYC